MSADNTDAEDVAKPSDAQSSLAFPLVLAVLLGIFLTIGAAGGYLYFRQINAHDLTVHALEQTVKDKTATITELQGQIEALSRQIHTLRDYAVARSTAAEGKEASAGERVSSAAVPVDLPSPPVEKEKAAVTSAAPLRPKAARAKAQNCDLVGKSSKEQVETLRRCVSLIDPPEGNSRSR